MRTSTAVVGELGRKALFADVDDGIVTGFTGEVEGIVTGFTVEVEGIVTGVTGEDEGIVTGFADEEVELGSEFAKVIRRTPLGATMLGGGVGVPVCAARMP